MHYDRRSLRSTTALALALLCFAPLVLAQPRAKREPTRDEILRGALGPLRTCYDVTSYHLDVRIDPATRSIRGSNEMVFDVVTDFERLQIDLFSNMVVEKITFDDDALATFTRELNAVFVKLPRTVRKGNSHKLTIHYSGEPIVARNPPWQGGFTWESDAAGNPWVVVTCQGTGASLWWPHKDHPADEPDRMALSVTVPPGLDEISNGRLVKKTPLEDGWVRHDWAISYPINNYCVTVNIGKYAHFSDEYTRDGETLTLDYWVLPKNLEKAKVHFEQTKTMLAVFEKYFGPYPFPRDGFKLIESPHTGMEHQSAIAYGNRYQGGYRGRAPTEAGKKFDFIIIHEAAHEWWGNSVTQKDIADMWIHESFGAYAESLFIEEEYGRAEALKYINAKKRGVRNRRPIISEYGLNRASAGDMYDKGQLILNTLRSVLDDDELWISILRGLQETFRHQVVSGEEVFGYIQRRAERDLSFFFEQYFKHPKIPILLVETRRDGEGSTVVRHRWHTDAENFRMRVKVTTAPGEYEFVTPTSEWQTLRLRGMAPEDFAVAEDHFYITVAPYREF